MGRKRKIHGRLYEGASPSGKAVRYRVSETTWASIRPGKAPRGATGKAVLFTSCLKEFSPAVYAYSVDQLALAEEHRDPMFRTVLAEYQRMSLPSRVRPPAKEFAAFVIQRALRGAWKIWHIQPPYTGGDVDTFWRRYVHGHPGALRDYRQILQCPRPWPPDHWGHVLKHFFGLPGEAAREFGFLTTKVEPITVVSLFEEENAQNPS